MKKRLHKPLILISILICIIVSFVVAVEIAVESSGWRIPKYEKKDISLIFQKVSPIKSEKGNELTQEDYDELFLQTGIGRPLAEELLNSSEGKKLLMRCQEDLFEYKKINCKRIGIITKEERFNNKSGENVAGFNIASVREGDIFITFSTHSLGWRHGHAAIVVSCEPLQTLEAEVLGMPSRIVKKSKWNEYSTFVQLRLKEEHGGAKTASRSAEIAKKQLVGIEYGFLCDKKKENIKKCQCAFIVWWAYNEVGIDIDGNGGIMVFPSDLGKSSYFDVIQVFGLDLTTKQ